MNLFLALFWSLCAVVLFAYEQFIGAATFRIRVSGNSFSAAWLMLGLALYNVARWWSNRSYRAEQRAIAIARANREWERRPEHRQPAEPPDPNFNFTDQPTSAPNPQITDQPPSNN